ncbi:V-type ATP synthase subunit D [Eubacteriales bacterium OttesenSCG-928-G02]|nr:V-type ATP synthase subunit D [Eubacteriales bacterium OttesenSCG-928-G02]
MNSNIPTKANLMAVIKSLKLARTGYELMERKKNIIQLRLSEYEKNIDKLRAQANNIFDSAYTALRNANITLGIRTAEVKSVPIDNGIALREKGQLGIEFVNIEYTPQERGIYYGLENTGMYLDDAYLLFNAAKEAALKVAEAEANLSRLSNALDKTQKRSNALKNIVIPRLEKQAAAITAALEEKEREEFSRLKSIKK